MLGLSEIIGAITHLSASISVRGLCGGARGLVLSKIVANIPDKPVLVITSTLENAEKFIDDCRVFFPSKDNQRLRLFPDGGVLPFSRISPDPHEWADRLEYLYELACTRPIILVAPITAIMRRVPKKSFIETHSKKILLNEETDPIELTKSLSQSGYEDVGLVEDEGGFARRGGILDIWSPVESLPVRLEFDGDRIISMRAFDPASQRSKDELREITVIPVRDFPFDDETRSSAIAKIRERAEDADLPSRDRRTITEAIKEGIAFSGIETFMPFFHDSTSTLFDYLPKGTTIFVDDAVDVELCHDKYLKEVDELRSTTSSPEKIVSVEEIIVPKTEIEKYIKSFRCVVNGPSVAWQSLPVSSLHIDTNTEIKQLAKTISQGEELLRPIIERIKNLQGEGMKIVVTCHNDLQSARLTDLFAQYDLEVIPFDGQFEQIFESPLKQIRVRICRLTSGFLWRDIGLCVITDEEIFGSKIKQKVVRDQTLDPFGSFSELTEGDYIVHELHGIGRYLGLVHLTIDNKSGDYLLLEYLGGDKLYLPVYRLNLIGRYIGKGDSAPFLDRLGSNRFSLIKKRVDASIRIMAKELLDIYAAREVFPGFPFPDPGNMYEEFSAEFPYDETPDQAGAIDEVIRDMKIEKPMDRLICGDVGYGKTEVAMRAAFWAASAGKQVAVLVPTTVLALQHYDTFARRFSAAPITIEMLSRFRSAKLQKGIIQKLQAGSIDIIIGTHRLLQRDIKFRDLGLLIIDEEHRFGVRHKERIKKLKAMVDVITLTATPIPRTLNLSLSGIRDISVINTPPMDRLSIDTHIVPFDEGIIRHAILKEIARGGQVFFVHNRVETIRSMYERLIKIIPEVRIVIGHGQLNERELEKVMIDFIEKRADVLLCTTIIESGLDISSANTMIINRADCFGLAQLYQLRGRVGRSNVRAEAYLLIPEDGEISDMAKRRLSVLTRFTELGSGFQIAMHDLEFRGAGNILGGAQSGHIEAIGYEMYTRLLNKAIKRLKASHIEEEIDPELSLKVDAFLPEAYIADTATRVELYRRLANRELAEEIISMRDELQDRFGVLPQEARNLIGVMEIKVLARELRIKQLNFDKGIMSCQLAGSTPIEPAKVLAMKNSGELNCRIAPPDRLIVILEEIPTGDVTVLEGVKNALKRLGACVSSPGNE